MFAGFRSRHFSFAIRVRLYFGGGSLKPIPYYYMKWRCRPRYFFGYFIAMEIGSFVIKLSMVETMASKCENAWHHV